MFFIALEVDSSSPAIARTSEAVREIKRMQGSTELRIRASLQELLPDA
jgi:hypothetical protein